ncbi:class I SAM-dependent methyltransferase [Vibrio fluvialis]|nr:class I SAM-dependent methyltransferase [Vibrio fluvialis]ELI5739769.1 class I SAM-dependent methyltransferase [Vibrio fluvialis]
MNYYDDNAQDFYNGTINVEMMSLYEQFIPHLEKGAFILDAGCGSGRDTLAFKSLGYRVHAIDASRELAKLAEELIGQPVEVTTFQRFEAKDEFDAVWACASLLHVPYRELVLAFNNLSAQLKSSGVFYCSFKYGEDEVVRDGRHFTNLNESRLASILEETPLAIMKTWLTSDLRKGRENERWLNALLIKG